MNKVFLDPNTKYSDQYAMLAKLPEVVDVVNETAEKVDDIPEIPAPAVADIGKVLGVVSDGESGAEYGAVAPAGGLPAIESGDAGKVLTVNAGETGAEWDSVEALPAIESGDAGKVLTVNDGETAAEWAAAGGGLTKVLEFRETSNVSWSASDMFYMYTKSSGATFKDENFDASNYLAIIEPSCSNYFYDSSQSEAYVAAGVSYRSLGSNLWKVTAQFYRLLYDGITPAAISFKPVVKLFKLE